MDGAGDGGPSAEAMTACHSWHHNGVARGATRSGWGSCGPRHPLGASPYAVADGGAWRECRWVLCPDGDPSMHPRMTRAKGPPRGAAVRPTGGGVPRHVRLAPDGVACISFLEVRDRNWLEK